MDDRHCTTCRKPSSQARAKEANLSNDATGKRLFIDHLLDLDLDL